MHVARPSAARVRKERALKGLVRSWKEVGISWSSRKWSAAGWAVLGVLV